jgi:hypothetical protein
MIPLLIPLFGKSLEIHARLPFFTIREQAGIRLRFGFEDKNTPPS